METSLRRAAALVAVLLWILSPGAAMAVPATFDDLFERGVISAATADRVSLMLNQAYLDELDRTPSNGISGWLSRERQRARDNVLRARAAQGTGGPSAVDDHRFTVSAKRFVAAYAAEQIRLARLFGRAPSEIESFPGERTGWDLPDRTLVLTFDDGPQPSTTSRILAALRANKVAGMFFVLGRKAATSGRKVDYTGYVVGSHTWSHLMITEAAPGALQEELERTRRAIAEAGVAPSKWFRAPYGARRERDLKVVERERLQSVLWNIDSQDWQDDMQRRRDRIANRIVALSLLRRRGIVLCHDIVPATADMLDGLIKRLTALGFHFQSL